MKRRVLVLLIVILNLVQHLTAQEQEYDSTLSYYELWNDILTTKKWVDRLQTKWYTLQNVRIVREKETDLEVNLMELIQNNPFLSDKSLSFINVEFPFFWADNANLKNVYFENCSFLNDFYLLDAANSIEVNNCRIEDGIYFNISDPNKPALIKLLDTDVNFHGNDRIGNDSDILNGSEHTNLIILRCTFSTDSSYAWLEIGRKNPPESTFENAYFSTGTDGFRQISIDSCVFDIDVSFNGIRISDFIEINHSEFKKKVSFHRVKFPAPPNISIEWDQLSGAVALIDRDWILHRGEMGDFRGFQPLEKNKYQAISDDELKNDIQFKNLMSVYQEFLRIYKARGDLENANACYVEMKDLETRRLNYIYRTEGGMKAYFDWRLNQFLKYFAEYGTSPVRSLIISLYVVLIFACFYFFFYSEWDRINRLFLMRKYNKLLQYFRSEQRLEDFYTEQHKEKFISYEEFRDNMKASRKEVPGFIAILGRPLYHLSVVWHKVMTWLYRRTEILSGRWEDIKGGRKVYVAMVVGLTIIFYSCYLMLVRALNSLFLSINTFSTLGFGEIPVKGLSRYVAILQGFIGWFLLSIFSVSLISQILQN